MPGKKVEVNMKMTTVRGKNGRRYEVRSTLYGTSNLVQRLYYGGIYLAGTEKSGQTIESAIERADKRVEDIGIDVSD